MMNTEESWLQTKETLEKLNNYYFIVHGDWQHEIPDIPANGSSSPQTVNASFSKPSELNNWKQCTSHCCWTHHSHHQHCNINTTLPCYVEKGWNQSHQHDKETNPLQFKEMKPISLLFHVGNVTDRVITNQLTEKITKLNNQFVYTKFIGTTEALMKLSTDISLYLYIKDTIEIAGLNAQF